MFSLGDLVGHAGVPVAADAAPGVRMVDLPPIDHAATLIHRGPMAGRTRTPDWAPRHWPFRSFASWVTASVKPRTPASSTRPAPAVTVNTCIFVSALNCALYPTVTGVGPRYSEVTAQSAARRAR